MKFSPISGHIIFKIVDAPNKTASDLLIVQSREAETQWAQALAVSTYARDQGVSEGDYLLVFMKGVVVNRLLGKEYYGVHVSNVLSVIHVEEGDRFEIAPLQTHVAAPSVIEGGKAS